MTPAPELPDRIQPMLAKIGTGPFDSAAHLFEVKWDGTRALAFVDAGGVRAHNRRGADLTPRYPELGALARLPRGVILDGELVVVRGGIPELGALLEREQARIPKRVEQLARSNPATYVVFDLLYRDYQPLLSLPLRERRALLERVIEPAAGAEVALSEGVAEAGTALFGSVLERGLEGMMAKRLDSRYLAGRRSDAWLKIKAKQRACCVVIGFLPDGEHDLKSLIIAVDDGGELRCAGKVGSGLTAADRANLSEQLRQRVRKTPVIPCKLRGTWVEPEIYVDVEYLEQTKNGELRAPVYKGVIAGA